MIDTSKSDEFMYTDMYNCIFKFCSHLCHQNPDRSFSFYELQFFLCARCTGLYLGLVIGFIYSIIKEIQIRFLHYIMIIIALMINTLTFMHIFDTNLIRSCMGILLGVSIGLLFGISFKKIIQ